MDKDEKLAKARKKVRAGDGWVSLRSDGGTLSRQLKRFQAQSSPDGSPRGRRKAPATPPSEVVRISRDS